MNRMNERLFACAAKLEIGGLTLYTDTYLYIYICMQIPMSEYENCSVVFITVFIMSMRLWITVITISIFWKKYMKFLKCPSSCSQPQTDISTTINLTHIYPQPKRSNKKDFIARNKPTNHSRNS